MLWDTCTYLNPVENVDILILVGKQPCEVHTAVLTCLLDAVVPVQLSFQSLCSAIQICLTCASLSGQSNVWMAGCVFSSHCLRYPDWDQIHRSTDHRVSPGFHKQLHEFIFLNSSPFVVSLVLCLPGMLPFCSPVRKLEVYLCHAFSLTACIWDKWRVRKEKRNKWGSPHPLGITVLPVGEEGSLQSEF